MNVAARVDPVLLRLTGGRIDLSLGLLPVVLLTVRGAKSGRERTVPILYFTEADDVVVAASSFGRPRQPAWYFNLKANPEVTLAARGRRGRYVARQVEGPERARLYELAKNVFAGYGVYERRTAGIREVPVFRLSPVQLG